jgi:hypothetical protein
MAEFSIDPVRRKEYEEEAKKCALKLWPLLRKLSKLR